METFSIIPPPLNRKSSLDLAEPLSGADPKFNDVMQDYP
jgi:hypothetical protein